MSVVPPPDKPDRYKEECTKLSENNSQSQDRIQFHPTSKTWRNHLNQKQIEDPGGNGHLFALPSVEQSTLVEEAMRDGKFDLFRKLPDGQPMWIRAVEGLEEAKRQLSQMAETYPGDYFIYNSRNGQVIAA